MSGNTPVTTRLEREDLALLDELVAATGKSRQDVMRQMLREGHERHGGIARAHLLDEMTFAYGAGARLTVRLTETGVDTTVDAGEGAQESDAPLTSYAVVERRDANGQAALELVDVLPSADSVTGLPARLFLASVPARSGYAITVNLDDLSAS